MRIAFLIGNFVVNTGVGGHYYSVLVTADEMIKAGHDVVVVCIGNRMSPVIEAWSTGDSKFISFHPTSFVSTVRDLSRYLGAWKPDVIQAFDVHSALFARICSAILKTKYALTVCGGAPPKRYFPKINNIAVFSLELDQWFRKRNVPNIKLIPNRINKFGVSNEKIAQIKSSLNADAIKILRISRINDYYIKSITQTINLAALVRRSGVEAQALIVGEVSDESTKRRIEALLHPDDRLITDAGLTRNAKQIIDVAEFVVGTGRSFMEAASRERILFCPSKSYDIPVLITEDNFDDAFRNNFSERVEVKTSEQENERQILRSVNSMDFRTELKAFLYNKFEAEFSAEPLVQKYLEFYNSYIPDRLTDRAEIGLHALSFFKSHFQFHTKKSRSARGSQQVISD